MSNIIKAERRHRAEKKQQKRLKNLKINWPSVEEHSNFIGQLRNNHFGCGCSMCKPWKHKLDKKLKPSERKKLNEKDNL